MHEASTAKGGFMEKSFNGEGGKKARKLRQELQKAEARIAQLESEKTRGQNTTSSWENKKAEFANQIALLHNQVQILQAQLEKVLAEKDSLIDKLKNASKELDALMADGIKFQHEKEALAKELQTEKDAHKRDVDELHEKLKERESEFDKIFEFSKRLHMLVSDMDNAWFWQKRKIYNNFMQWLGTFANTISTDHRA